MGILRQLNPSDCFGSSAVCNNEQLMMSGPKPKIGDLCEIKTPAGLAYVQFTHDLKKRGQLVRVLPGLFHTRPTDFGSLAKQRELYFTFYTLNYAVDGQQAEIVSSQPIPEWAQPYPLMRWGMPDRNGRVADWKIFSASTSLTVEEHQRTPLTYNLTPQQLRLSVYLLRPHPAMVKDLARGWTPERDEALRLQDIAEAERRGDDSTSDKRASEPMKHYLYFAEKANAEEAGEQLRSRDFLVQVRKAAGGEDWLVLATKTPPRTRELMDQLRDEMETLAIQFGGQYDGWEAAIDSLAGDVEHGRQIN